jgi:hypothetical protein
MLRVIALSVVVSLAVPAIAAPAETQTLAQQANAAPAKEKRICRTDTGTGSIMPKRICHTQAEWDSLNADSRKAAEDMTDNQMQHMGQPR